jgi:multiple sugar transport system permease protein
LETILPSPLTSFPPKKRFRFRWIDVKEQLTGYLFILPSVALIALFGFFPIGYAFYMSMYNWLVKKGGYNNFNNYKKAVGDFKGLLFFIAGIALLVFAYWLWNKATKSDSTIKMVIHLAAAILVIPAGLILVFGWDKMLATGDKAFLHTLPITLYYSIGTVPAELAIGLVLAYILFQKIHGKEFFRMLYFLPYITPAVATAVVFRSIFNPRDSSLANQVISLFGGKPLKWLFEPNPFNKVVLGVDIHGFFSGPSLALVSIMLFGIWTYIGYNTVIFLAGLGSISHELYEAAEIDGAGPWQSFRHLTLPLLSPITFYLAIIAFIGTFKAFNHIYVMRTPAAQDTVNVASVYIFETFYKQNQFGYATAQAILLFVIILGLTFVQNKLFGEKVFYG